MSEEKELNVTVIPPRDKHPTIMRTFEALSPGGAFILVNDHDPVPLRHQFTHQYPDKFGWEYIEKGPETWKVRISRTQQ